MARLYADENFPLPVTEELRRLGHDVLTIQETGKGDHAVAVLVPVCDSEDLESLLLARSPEFQRLLADAEQRIQETGGITHEELCRRLGASP